MSNPEQLSFADFTLCGAAGSLKAFSACLGLTAPAGGRRATDCSEAKRTECKEAGLALVAAVAGIAMWAALTYELASRLQVPMPG